MILLSIVNAHCRIASNKLLDIPEFTLRIGEHWCVLGGNGAGKSLLSSLVQGQLTLGAAAVHYQAEFSAHNDIIVVSFEEQQKLWAMDNRHDISEFSENAQDQGTTVKQLILGNLKADARYADILRSLALDELEERGIRYLSSGQCRKAMLARALFQRPKLLILDEPLESIDRTSQDHIVDALKQWMGPQTCTLLLCRRARDILPNISHLALMHGLRILQQGPIADVQSTGLYTQLTQRRAQVPESLPNVDISSAHPVFDPKVALLELKHVNAGYHGRLVLEDVSWTMRYGQHTLIEGPNGCGKSTLLSLINGENHMAYGQQVYLFGRLRGTGETVWDVKARFGVVSNEIHNRYVKGWRVLDVVVSGFFDSVGLYDDSSASQHQVARAWLRALGIDSLSKEYYHALSFGQQRLVLLARAMVKQPSILILDEACVGLDDEYRELILALTDLIANSQRTHIIFVSHTAGEVPSCINQVIRFEGKQLVLSDAIDQQT